MFSWEPFGPPKLQDYALAFWVQKLGRPNPLDRPEDRD